jgi:hypothetical protein
MAIWNKFFGSKEAEFQKRVIATLESDFVQPTSNPLQVQVANVDIDLSELYKTCQSNQVQSVELIRQHFSFPLAFALHTEHSWNEVESMVRPQLVPAEIARAFEIQLFPFAQPIAACAVIKMDGYQMFVRAADLSRWEVAPEELLNRAVLNLDSDKVETEVTVTDGADRFIGLESHDGFDAARILLPRVRELAAVKLGIPYLAGFPNRDFLILWSTACSPRFQEYAREKIETDYSIQNFPLSSFRFQVNDQTIIAL